MAKSSKKPPAKAGTIGANIEAGGLFNLFMQGLDPRIEQKSDESTGIPVDMYSTDHTVIIEAELPGIKPNELELTYFKNSLIIKAVKYDCFDDENVNYVCMERTFGKVTRTVDIPVPINSMKIHAVYKNGILTIEMPRVEDKRGQPKQIAIEFPEK